MAIWILIVITMTRGQWVGGYRGGLPELGSPRLPEKHEGGLSCHISHLDAATATATPEGILENSILNHF